MNLNALQIAQNLFNQLRQTVQPVQQAVTHVIQPVEQTVSHIAQPIIQNFTQPQVKLRASIQTPIANYVARQPVPLPIVPISPSRLPTIGNFTQNTIVPAIQQSFRYPIEAKQTPILQNIIPGTPLPNQPITPPKSILLGNEPLRSFTDVNRPGGQLLTNLGLPKPIVQAGTPALALAGAVSNLPEGAGEKTLATGIKNFVTNTLGQRTYKTLRLFGAQPKTIQTIGKALGMNVKNYSHEIDNYAVTHVLNEHGVGANLRPNEVPVTLQDFNLIPQILKNPDNIKVSPNRTGYGNRALIYNKKIGDNIYYIEEIQNRNKRLALKTMYKSKIPNPVGDASQKVTVPLRPSLKTENPTGSGINNSIPQPVKVSSETSKYLTDLQQGQKAAEGKPSSLIQKGKGFLANLKTQLIDSASPIEDAVTLAEKQHGFQIRPTNDVRLQIDRVLRSKSLASQFAEDNGLTDVIKNAPDLTHLDQFMIAKQSSTVAKNGIKTGRDLVKDQQLIKELAPTYEPYAKQVNQYSRNLLDYSVKSGLISKELATKLTQKYPDYVPLNRVFSELEQNGYQGATKSIANLSRQTVVQKLQGSERAIHSPIESLLLKTQTAFQQGEKNIAAKQLASYKDLPGLKGLITPVKSSPSQVFTTSNHTFSYLDNGVKKVFATTPEIAAAAKNLNKEQMNIVIKFLSYPTRALQLGATSLNIPFAGTNLLKDQVDTFINSNRAAKTSLANPSNFLQALFAATKHNDLYKEANRNAAISTSFDIARNQPDLTVNKIRASKTTGSQVKYLARNPGELLRSFENIVGRTEELTRIQNYQGQYQALLKEGRTPEDARLLAAQAARNNTANFARSGDIGKVINYVIPFFNAGIQGSRTFIRAMQQNPKATSAKLAVGLFLPVAATTMWNMTDPNRKQVYNDIQESEKERNIIIIPDGATQDANGKWNVIKIPLPPGLANLSSLVRRGIEQTQGGNPVAIKEVFDSLIGATTPLDTSTPSKFIGGFTPQAIKPFLEGVTNTNLYTGNKIVPDSMKNLPAQDQVKPNTSPIAKVIGKATGISPLIVENAFNTGFGGVGGQILGTNPVQQLANRFTQASGGGQENTTFDNLQKYQQNQAEQTLQNHKVATSVISFLQDPSKSTEDKQKILQILSQPANSTVKQEVIQSLSDNANKVSAAERAIRALSLPQRTQYILDSINNEKDISKKQALLTRYQKIGIITPTVIQEMKVLLSKKK